MRNTSGCASLKGLLNLQDMKRCTQKLVELHRGGHHQELEGFWRSLTPRASEVPEGRGLFLELLKLFHPDRITWHENRMEDQAYLQWYDSFLQVMKGLLNTRFSTVDVHSKRPSTSKEEYGHDEGDYHQSWNWTDGRYQDDWLREEGNTKLRSFIDALKDSFLGNRDYAEELTAEDVQGITGDLDLSSMDIEDLDGLEWLFMVDSLNLAGNRIERLSNMENLYNLKELYLSENDLDDIEGLAPLESLVYLDLSSNPIEDYQVLLKLEQLEFLDLRGCPKLPEEIRLILGRRDVLILE